MSFSVTESLASRDFTSGKISRSTKDSNCMGADEESPPVPKIDRGTSLESIGNDVAMKRDIDHQQSLHNWMRKQVQKGHFFYASH